MLTSNNLKSNQRLSWVAIVLCLLLSACADRAKLNKNEDTGTNPVLPDPPGNLIPTVNVAKAVGWPSGTQPEPANGLAVNAFATSLDHPRWLYVLPNGDVLVAETNAPAKPDDGGGITAWVTRRMMKKAGSAVPSADRITLLRDADGDGRAELQSIFLENLTSPFGVALVDDWLYVANTDALVRFRYTDGATRLDSTGERLAELPGGPINHHWTKNVIANADGSKLYITVGSNSNIAENGMENENMRAAILEFEMATGQLRVFASGLRNPNGLAWEPYSGELWTTVNERDLLGSDLVPDYMTAVQDGGFYGWPYSYYGQHIDERVQPQKPELVASALVPDYALGAHTAPLGLVFYEHTELPERFTDGAFVAQHGSWNRKPHSGYQVIFIPFKFGEPHGKPVVALSGFLNEQNQALGRPTGLAVSNDGALLVADDVGNIIWRVSKMQATP